MEFLLINHPLDCPICDQGGECQLQDLAVGYGGSASRYTEPKRVVFHKNLGPLDLRRGDDALHPLHALRALRPGDRRRHGARHDRPRRARGDRRRSSARRVDSELSGNMIDLCPVGALTSKPFRYAARTWELSRRKSVSPHDSLGSNLDRAGEGRPRDARAAARERGDQRVLDLRQGPLLLRRRSTRDERLTRADGQARAASGRRSTGTRRSTFVAHGLNDDRRRGTAPRRSARSCRRMRRSRSWRSPRASSAASAATTSTSACARPISAATATARGVPWLGMPIAEIATLDRVLVVGSFLRKDHPLLAQRLRQAAQEGRAGHRSLHAVDDDWLMPRRAQGDRRAVAAAAGARRDRRRRGEGRAASRFPAALAGIEPVAAAQGDRREPAVRQAQARSCSATTRVQHPEASQLHALAQALAEITGATLGFLTEAANSVGRATSPARCRRPRRPERAGDARASRARRTCCCTRSRSSTAPIRSRRAPRSSRRSFVVVMSPFRHGSAYADVLLPISPFTETAGTFVNCEGRAAELPRRREAARRDAPGVEGAARARLDARACRTSISTRSDEVRAASLPADAGRSRRACSTTDATSRSRSRRAQPRRHRARRRRADLLRRSAGAPRAGRCSRPPTRSRRRRACTATLLDQLGVAEGAQVKVQAGPRRSGVDGRRRRRRCRPVSSASPRRIASTCGLEGLSGPGHAWSAHDVDAMHRSPATCERLLGPAWPVVWTLVEDRRHRGPADPVRRLPDVRRAQGHRLDAGAHRPESRRAARACCSRSPTWSSCSSRRSSSRRGRTGALFFIAPMLALGTRARRVGRRAVHRHAGAREHQRRAAVHPRDDVGRRVRHHPRRLGVELEVRVPRLPALRRADRVLRDRDGLRAGRRADGAQQPEPARDRARPGGRRRALVHLAAVPAVRRLPRVGHRRDQPASVRRGGRRVGDRRRLPRRVLGHHVRAVLPRRVHEHDPDRGADVDHVPRRLALAVAAC